MDKGQSELNGIQTYGCILVNQRHAGGDDVRKDIQKIKVPNWKTLAQDRRRWKELVEKAKTL